MRISIWQQFSRNKSTAVLTIILFGLFCVLLGANHFPISAQTSTPDEFEPIFGGGINIAEWLPDNATFIFSPNEPDWFVFDTHAWNRMQVNRWPLLPALSSDEINVYGLTLANFQVGDPIYALAPDGNTLVFARQVSCGEMACSYHLVLADRRTRKVFDTQSNVNYPFNVGAFHVIWNRAGTAFTLVQSDGFGGVYGFLSTYVTNYSSDISHAQATTAIGSPQINGKTYASHEAFMFSPNDSTLLIRALDPKTLRYSLIAYDLADPNRSVIVPEQYGSSAVAAGFAPGASDRILIFNSSGLLQYDLSTGSVIVLNKNLDTVREVRAAWFSPDGTWFAYDSTAGALYVIRLSTQSEGLFTPTSEHTPH